MIWPRKVSHGSGRDTCNLKKLYSTRQDDFIFSEKKNSSSSVESGLSGQGMGKKKKSLAGELWICF